MRAEVVAKYRALKEKRSGTKGRGRRRNEGGTSGGRRGASREKREGGALNQEEGRLD